MPTERSQLIAAQRIDSVCDRFESDWRAGKKPRIEDLLAAAEDTQRDALFRALLPIELELRGRAKEKLSTVEYKSRFPNRAEAIVEIFRALAERSRAATGDTSVSRESVRSPESIRRPRGIVVGTGPSKLGRFELVELLGEGAFGQVFRARDPQLDRDVAIKVPREGVVPTEADRERFLREARALATLHHPNICSVYEVGESDGKLYTVMTYIAGKSLAEAIKERKEPLPVRQAVQIVRKLALALDAAHSKGVVHRDLKPANIMFDKERKDVVVMDFGLARRSASNDAEITQQGMIMGTPAYMAPEQARADSKAIGPASDVYALGVILYELLTGKRPFTGSAGEMIGKVLHVEPDPPSKWRPDLDPRLVAVCQKAMAKDIAQRYGSMKDFAAALASYVNSYVNQPTAGATPTPTTAAAMEPASEETLGLQQLFDALSQERKQTKADVEAAIRKAKTPWWLWVACAGIAGLIVAGGIIFFTRSDKVKVTIELTDVDLADKSLSFFLDEEQIPAEAISKPIELSPGEHVLVVKRGKDIVVRKLLTVSGGRSPGIKVKDIPLPEPKPPDKTDAERLQGHWVCTFEESVGKVWTDEELQKADKKLVVDGERFAITRTLNRGRGTYDGRFVLNPSATPKHFDFYGKGPGGADLHLVGIYDLQGDHFRLCYAINGPRSSAFTSRGPGIVNLVFKRAPVGDGFVQLFNGKDLTGWTVAPGDKPSPWAVKDGAIRGSTVNSGPSNQQVLLSKRGDYRDVHVRVECKYNGLGGGGVCARGQFGGEVHTGYQLLIGHWPWEKNVFTGSLILVPGSPIVKGRRNAAVSDRWHTVESIVRGHRCTHKLDGEIVLEYVDADQLYKSGHIGLQFRHPFATKEPQEIWYRKVEVMELPVESAPSK